MLRWTFLAVLLVTFCVANGQRLLEKSVRAVGSVNQTCVNLRTNAKISIQERCQFFDCFEKRFPCGPQYFVANFGLKYCVRYTSPKFLEKVDADAAEFALKSTDCTLASFEKLYPSTRSMRCKRLFENSFEVQTKCYSKYQNLFCAAFTRNVQHFLKVIDNNDLMNPSLMGMMKQLGSKCDPPVDIMQFIWQGK